MKKDGRNIPLDIIERGLRDGDCDVRAAAMKACDGRDIPPSRTFEPQKYVYKKCANNVIVVAEIPDDAHIRGKIGKKCRASKAKIVNIIGDVFGEKVGISLYNTDVWYFIGDVIEIPDFDLSDNECSTGFHFFCAEEEARNYNFE